MSWVGQRSWQGIGGCAYVEGVLHNVVELQNTPLHAHDLGSGRGESDPFRSMLDNFPPPSSPSSSSTRRSSPPTSILYTHFFLADFSIELARQGDFALVVSSILVFCTSTIAYFS